MSGRPSPRRGIRLRGRSVGISHNLRSCPARPSGQAVGAFSGFDRVEDRVVQARRDATCARAAPPLPRGLPGGSSRAGRPRGGAPRSAPHRGPRRQIHRWLPAHLVVAAAVSHTSVPTSRGGIGNHRRSTMMVGMPPPDRTGPSSSAEAGNSDTFTGVAQPEPRDLASLRSRPRKAGHARRATLQDTRPYQKSHRGRFRHTPSSTVPRAGWAAREVTHQTSPAPGVSGIVASAAPLSARSLSEGLTCLTPIGGLWCRHLGSAPALEAPIEQATQAMREPGRRVSGECPGGDGVRRSPGCS